MIHEVHNLTSFEIVLFHFEISSPAILANFHTDAVSAILVEKLY